RAIHESPVLFDLAYHYIEGGNQEKALIYGLPAAEKAKASYANDNAINYYKIVINILEKKAKRDDELWIRVNEELAEVYLTIGMNDLAINICNDILPLQKNALEKAKVYRKIGIAFFKKGDWEKCEDALLLGLKLLGENVPKKKKGLIISIIKEFFVYVLHKIFPVFFMSKEGKTVKPKDKEIILIYTTLNWMYILSDVFKLICTILRTLNITKSRIGKSPDMGQALGEYASLLMAIPFFKKSIKYHKKALKIREASGDEWGVAQSLQWLGYCYLWQGDSQKSNEVFQISKEKFQRLGDIWELGIVVNGLGYVDFYKGNFNGAYEFYSQYLKICQKTRDNYGITSAIENIAQVYTNQGIFIEAEEWYKKGLYLSEEEKIWFATCSILINFSYLQIEKSNWEQAIKFLERAKKLYEKNTFLKEYTVYLYSYLAEAYIGELDIQSLVLSVKEKKQKIKRIKRTCNDALKNSRSWVNHHAIALRATAKYYALIKKNKKAEKYFFKSIQQTKSLGKRYELARCYYEYGNYYQSINKSEDAREEWRKAYCIFREIGSAVYIKRISDLLGVTIGETSSKERFIDKRRLSSIVSISQQISSILNIEELLENIISKAIEITGAIKGYLFIVNEDTNKLELRAMGNIKQLVENDDFQYPKEIINDVYESGKAIISHDAQKDLDLSDIKSILCVPINFHDKIIGVFYLDNSLSSAIFTEDDVELLNVFLSQAATSIENTKLIENLKEKERLKQEMKIAERIQTSLFPLIPKHKELDIAAVMKPAEEVGG
ncbi:MAG: GAF domain-containing protein, partial [Spirochaetes bacterium]|nr:GAF domain-containing protein [Spirochaetota bacterium]